MSPFPGDSLSLFPSVFPSHFPKYFSQSPFVAMFHSEYYQINEKTKVISNSHYLDDSKYTAFLSSPNLSSPANPTLKMRGFEVV